MAKNAIHTAEEFGLALTKLTEELFATAITYDLYLHLGEKFKGDRKAYVRSRMFWDMVRDGLLSQTILTLCRIYDMEGNNSLLTLLKWKETAEGIDVSTDRAAIGPASEAMVKRLTDWRGNVLAHTSVARTIGRKKQPKGVVPNYADLHPLIDRAMEIVTHLGNSTSREITEVYGVGLRQDADFVFESSTATLKAWEGEVRVYLRERGVDPDVFLEPERMFDEWKRKNKLDLEDA